MLVQVKSRHDVASTAMRPSRDGTIALLLACGHVILGKKSHDSDNERARCSLCGMKDRASREIRDEMAALSREFHERMQKLEARAQNLPASAQHSPLERPRRDRTEDRNMILLALEVEQPMCSRQISETSGVNKDTVSKLLDVLHKEGVVRQVGKHPETGRIQWAISPKLVAPAQQEMSVS